MSIFENENALIENSLESAKALGGSFDIEKRLKRVYMAKKNCDACYGRGIKIWSFPGNTGFAESKKVRCHCVEEKEVEVFERVQSIDAGTKTNSEE